MTSVQYPDGVTPTMRQLLLDCAMLSDLAYNQPSYVEQRWAEAHKNQPAQTVTRTSKTVPRTSKTGPEVVLAKVPRMPKFVDCPQCDAQCYLVHYEAPSVENLNSKPVLAIVSRGTSSVMDFVCDGDIAQVQFRDASNKPLAGVKVHCGFYDQFIGLFSLFDVEVKQHLKDGGHLLCIGHSLGSADSTIAALNYASSYPGQVYFVGYGCPRVGNKAFADAFNKCVKLRLRVKNCCDPIAAILPPVCGYTHVGSELHLGSPDPLPQIPNMFSLGDHGIFNYQKNLAEPAVATTTLPQVTKSWYLTVVDAFKWETNTLKQ